MGKKKDVNFAGSPDVYSSSGYYTFNGKDSCGVDSETLQQVCKYTLHPTAPGVDMVSDTGLSGNKPLPDFSGCK